MEKQNKLQTIKARANEAISTAQARQQAARQAASRKTFILRLFGLNIEVSSQRANRRFLDACAQATAVKMQYTAILDAISSAKEANYIKA